MLRLAALLQRLLRFSAHQPAPGRRGLCLLVILTLIVVLSGCSGRLICEYETRDEFMQEVLEEIRGPISKEDVKEALKEALQKDE